MTVIAYRDGVLVSDGRTSTKQKTPISNNTVKIVKGPFEMGGASGRSEDCEAFRQWLICGNRGKKFKPRYRRSFSAIAIDYDGNVWYRSTQPDYSTMKDFYAIGSGCDLAMGAMEQGASAERAIEIATKWCAESCGGLITILNLRDRP